MELAGFQHLRRFERLLAVGLDRAFKMMKGLRTKILGARVKGSISSDGIAAR